MVASGARVNAHLTAILIVVVSADNSLHQTETLRENSGVGFLDDLKKLTWAERSTVLRASGPVRANFTMLHGGIAEGRPSREVRATRARLMEVDEV
jgi:hypothetical protein